MTERRALILFAIGAMLLQAVVHVALAQLGASSETLATTYALLLGVLGLAGGLIFLRYH